MTITFGLVVSARSNNWYQSQGHEFDSQRDNLPGEDCCRLHNCLVAEARWAESQSKSLILGGMIVEGEIVVGDINCPMTEARKAK